MTKKLKVIIEVVFEVEEGMTAKKIQDQIDNDEFDYFELLSDPGAAIKAKCVELMGGVYWPELNPTLRYKLENGVLRCWMHGNKAMTIAPSCILLEEFKTQVEKGTMKLVEGEDE